MTKEEGRREVIGREGRPGQGGGEGDEGGEGGGKKKSCREGRE